MTSECNDIEINHIIDKKTIDLSIKSNSSQDPNDCDYVCNKIYFKSSGRFEDLPQEIFDQELKCMSCALFDIEESMKTPKLGEEIQTNETNLSSTLKYKNLIYKNDTYFVGDCALLSSNAFNLPHFDYEDLKQSENDEPHDESLYPERYRKSFTDYVKGSNNDSPKPYNIGLIKEIYKQIDDTLEETKIVVNIFYRPQNVFDNYEDYRICDINLLFWSNEEITISVDSLRGICQVIYSKESPVIDFFVEPKVFYCNELYNNESKTFSALTQDIYNKFSIRETDENKSTNKLRILDLFSGCGGLAYGFEKIGIVSKVWAIEKDPSAVNSFRANFPSAVVFEEDVNHFLDLLLKGIKVDKNGQSLPQKGEIDLILGGPPCQGFSGMNRFSSRQYSLFKNSLVVSFLSYVDFYRPKYLLFENVRNFALFKSSMILKLTLSCLIRMGYKCQFAILQSANYGLPQTRRRTVIIGASSGFKLPYFPKPTHVFSLRQCQLSVNIDDRKYIAINETCAQFRAINVEDAISDLPKLEDDYSIDKVRHYNESIASHYQKILRKNSDNNLSDHLCKELSALCRARIENIPQSVGSDWRDLPNISHRLSDGTLIKKLVYLYDDIKNGKSRSGHFRGVCLCASGKSCNGSESRQENTLIPWCLVHTANRQYQWSGLYGRLSLKGYFPTTVTNPEPISKQGRVLHPNQNRVISIRESARSQGFPDHFKLVGSVLDRYRQIGNAVPIPLAIALAREFDQILN
jgi:DNA (cytosine-5)-methyltransferase 1